MKETCTAYTKEDLRQFRDLDTFERALLSIDRFLLKCCVMFRKMRCSRGSSPLALDEAGTVARLLNRREAGASSTPSVVKRK